MTFRNLIAPMTAFEYFKAIETDFIDNATGKLNPSWNELHICIASGSSAVIPTLINQGTDFNQQDSRGRTPLHLAAAMNKPQLCQLLLVAGADPLLEDHTGHTALQRAEIADFLKVMDAFRPVVELEQARQ